MGRSWQLTDKGKEKLTHWGLDFIESDIFDAIKRKRSLTTKQIYRGVGSTEGARALRNLRKKGLITAFDIKAGPPTKKDLEKQEQDKMRKALIDSIREDRERLSRKKVNRVSKSTPRITPKTPKLR